VIGSPIVVGPQPSGVAVTPDGGKLYVTDIAEHHVMVINTATDMVIGPPIPVGTTPVAILIQPGPRFAK
jgi:YVTN family beta-propeller protein